MYYRYSTRCILKDFPDSKKFKIYGVTLNDYQKPLLLFMKHIILKDELEIAKGLLSRQQNRLVIHSSPITLRPPEIREEASQQEHLPQTQVMKKKSKNSKK